MYFSNIRCYGKDCDHPAVADSPALQVDNLSFKYPGMDRPAVDDVTVAIKPGEKVALVGPNGAGKSTFMKLIVGLEKIQSGSISVYGHMAHSCKHRVAMVPQRSSVDWSFPVTVRQVVTMGRYVHLGWFNRLRPIDHEAVEKALLAMEITNLADRQVGDLSGGQQQRVMLARTLAHDADLLLMDEPLNHVDIATQELIFHVIESICTKGKSVLISSHDLGLLTIHFNRALFLDHKLKADGPIKEVLTAENIASAYGFRFHKTKELGPWLNG
ncbi:MAG: hypothetical protein B6241_14130 [Spirochaetaceae bacterium 4572_59]|nr:MAG: hypothetical protein B6241_14130 [Spirochaetaceae bacterium 4572_59]